MNWEIARQTAEWVALEGRPEPSVDPRDGTQFEELARAAQTLVVGETGLTATFATPLRTVGPQGWVDLHLAALRPVLEALASTLGEAMQAERRRGRRRSGRQRAVARASPAACRSAATCCALLAPALLGVQAGSMIGYLAQHALGRYDLPLPTGPHPRQLGGDEPSLTFVVPNIDAFEEAWSLPREDLRFYVALHEVVHAAVRSVPWVRGRLVRLAIEYVSSYEIDPGVFEARVRRRRPVRPRVARRRIAAEPASASSARCSPTAPAGAARSSCSGSRR